MLNDDTSKIRAQSLNLVVDSDKLVLLDNPGIRSSFKCILSFPGVYKRGSTVPTRASYVFIYSTFTYVPAAGPDL